MDKHQWVKNKVASIYNITPDQVNQFCTNNESAQHTYYTLSCEYDERTFDEIKYVPET